jgi:Icc-related predicted phosphoesterase
MTTKKKSEMHEGLKILAASDIHGDQSIVKKLAERAEKENVDLVVLCGDLTMNEMSTTNILGPFAAKHKKVLIIPGNHETVATADFMAEVYSPYARNIHGYSVKYKDVGIFGAGGATNVGPRAPISETEMYDLLKKGFDKISDLKKRIMVTHVHPTESRMEKFSSFVPGSTGVKKALDKFKPDILICGHAHEAQGLEEMIGKTRVINVGPKGKIINL